VAATGPGERRAAPPYSRRESGDPEENYGLEKPRLDGVWVMLSSAAASALLLMLTALGLSRFGPRAEEPLPPAIPDVSAKQPGPGDARPPSRLAATRREEF
jgi:hypothetical protein